MGGDSCLPRLLCCVCFMCGGWRWSQRLGLHLFAFLWLPLLAGLATAAVSMGKVQGVAGHMTVWSHDCSPEPFRLDGSDPPPPCFPGVYQPNRLRRHRSTGSSMRRWWSRPRREVGTTHPRMCAPTPRLTRGRVFAELKEAQRRKKQLQDRCKLEESIGCAVQTWNQDILPHWSSV